MLSKLSRISLIGLLLAHPLNRALALLNFDGTRNQLFVFGNVAYSYSSNIFSDSTERGDSSINGEVGIEVNRNAGIIAVNGIAKTGFEQFANYTDESSFNPNFSLEFVKTTGRTTGSLSLMVFRESRSDSAINLRTNSWNIPVGLKLRYPFSEKFHLTSETDYLRRTYSDDQAFLRDYRDLSEGLSLFYRHTSKLDFVGGYRIRFSKADGGADTYDHWFNFGATGALLAKLNGSLRLGYQIRDIERGESFDHFNILAALNWAVTRKLSLSNQISRDFNTVATGASVDSSQIALRGTYSFTRKIDADAGVAYGRNIFLGRNQAARRDDFFSADVGVGYRFNDHFRLAVSYTYMQNWSTLSFSDFDRHGFSINLSCRF